MEAELPVPPFPAHLDGRLAGDREATERGVEVRAVLQRTAVVLAAGELRVMRRSELSVNAAGLRWRAEVPADRHLIAFAMESPGFKRKRKWLQRRPPLSGSAPPGQVLLGHVLWGAARRSPGRFQLEGFQHIPGLDVIESVKGDHALLADGRPTGTSAGTPSESQLSDAAGPERAPVPRDPYKTALRDLALDNPAAGQHGRRGALDLAQDLGPTLAHQSVVGPLHGAHNTDVNRVFTPAISAVAYRPAALEHSAEGAVLVQDQNRDHPLPQRPHRTRSTVHARTCDH